MAARPVSPRPSMDIEPVQGPCILPPKTAPRVMAASAEAFAKLPKPKRPHSPQPAAAAAAAERPPVFQSLSFQKSVIDLYQQSDCAVRLLEHEELYIVEAQFDDGRIQISAQELNKRLCVLSNELRPALKIGDQVFYRGLPNVDFQFYFLGTVREWGPKYTLEWIVQNRPGDPPPAVLRSNLKEGYYPTSWPVVWEKHSTPLFTVIPAAVIPAEVERYRVKVELNIITPEHQRLQCRATFYNLEAFFQAQEAAAAAHHPS